jgi:hypothetical protein
MTESPELDPVGGPQRYEFDEYSVIFESAYFLGGGPAIALPGHDPASAYERFHEQFESTRYAQNRVLPKVLGMQKQSLIKIYGEPEVIDWTPPDIEPNSY